MNRKEKIYSYIASDEYIPLKQDELAIVLDVPKCDIGEFNSLISELENDGLIYKTKKLKLVATKTDTKTDVGILMCNANKKFGFVRCDDGDVFVPFEKLNGAYNKDRVLVRIDKEKNEHSNREGHIIKVLSRGNNRIVGVIKGIKGNKYRVAPDDASFFSDIFIAHDRLNGGTKGDRVLVSIDRYGERGTPYGSVMAVLGTQKSILSCLDGLLMQNSMFETFPHGVEEETDAIPQTVTDDDLTDREDLRDKITFTIDGDDSRDFDDAVSLDRADNGNLILGVHIADVTHYVKEGSQIAKEALKRATSVYFPHKVIPMLPKKLSNGICSLNPDVDRLTLSIFIEYDKDANVHSQRIAKSVIHSNARLTYNIVNRIFKGEKDLIKEYGQIVPVLNEMNQLSKKLENKRRERGAIDFDFPETKVICDKDANPVEIISCERGDSHKLIESFMIAANEAVAETAFWSELPFVYRVHEAPSNQKLTEFNEFIKNFGYFIKGKLDSETIHPKALQEIAQKVKGTPEELMISKIMLRSLMKACYRDTNDGHFGLASRFYCHFTSPIRRYPDLIIHRVLKEFVSGTLTETARSCYASMMQDAASISSEKEIEAETVERDAVEMLKAAYMRNYLGENFKAVISSVTSFGMFAMLENSCEGLIRYETMNGDYFIYDETSRLVYGKRTGKIYRIGDEIEITVAAADILSKRIDFIRKEDNDYQRYKTFKHKRGYYER